MDDKHPVVANLNLSILMEVDNSSLHEEEGCSSREHLLNMKSHCCRLKSKTIEFSALTVVGNSVKCK